MASVSAGFVAMALPAHAIELSDCNGSRQTNVFVEYIEHRDLGQGMVLSHWKFGDIDPENPVREEDRSITPGLYEEFLDIEDCESRQGIRVRLLSREPNLPVFDQRDAAWETLDDWTPKRPRPSFAEPKAMLRQRNVEANRTSVRLTSSPDSGMESCGCAALYPELKNPIFPRYENRPSRFLPTARSPENDTAATTSKAAEETVSTVVPDEESKQ